MTHPVNTASGPETAAGLPSFSLFGHRVAVSMAAPGLHVVATPIGNLKDITIRALTVLAGCDAVLAEDTRVTRRLLDHYGIQTRLIRHDAHASAERISGLVADLVGGARLALVSDAGTPLVSDPGLALARAAVEAGVPIHALPGASAVLTALVGSAIVADRFFFEGFLPQKGGERRRRLRELAELPAALIIYEAPHRIVDCLTDLLAVLGDRPAAAARELTKMHEEIRRDRIGGLLQHFEVHPPRGEFVLAIASPDSSQTASPPDPKARLADLLAEHSVKDAAAILAGETGLPKREAYALALRMVQAEKGSRGGADG